VNLVRSALEMRPDGRREADRQKTTDRPSMGHGPRDAAAAGCCELSAIRSDQSDGDSGGPWTLAWGLCAENRCALSLDGMAAAMVVHWWREHDDRCACNMGVQGSPCHSERRRIHPVQRVHFAHHLPGPLPSIINSVHACPGHSQCAEEADQARNRHPGIGEDALNVFLRA
jgi:hypothetical protein